MLKWGNFHELRKYDIKSTRMGFPRVLRKYVSQEWVILIYFMKYYRVYPVMENLEKSWNSIVFFQAWKSHGN